MASTTFSAGTVYSSAWGNDVDEVTYGIRGAVGDGVTDDTTLVLAALEGGKVVDGRGRTYAVTGTLAPSTFKGLRNCKLVQLAPTTANCKTLNLVSFTNIVLENIIIDRGGSAGYTVGSIGASADYVGLRIESCTGYMRNVLVTNGGRGTGIAMFSCTNLPVTDCGVTEHYWQEVNPGVPVIADDIIQPFWFNNNTNCPISGCYAYNITSGSVGDYTTNVAVAQYRRYTRWAFTGNTNCPVSNCVSYNIDQAFDFTGSVGNTNCPVTGCVAGLVGTVGFKQANSNQRCPITNCISADAGLWGFVVSGASEAAIPAARDTFFSNCIAYRTGSNAIWAASNPKGFAIEFSTFATNTPYSTVFDNCHVVDDQGSPTTVYGFYNNVAAITDPTANYNKPFTNVCNNCTVSVAGMTRGNQYFGIMLPIATLIGNGANTDTLANNTWTNLNLDQTDLNDPSGMHSPTSNADIATIKHSGLYVISVQAGFQSNATGKRFLRLVVNGGNVEDQIVVGAHPTVETYINGTFVRTLYEGDSVTLQGLQSSGGNLTCNRGDTVLRLVRVN